MKNLNEFVSGQSRKGSGQGEKNIRSLRSCIIGVISKKEENRMERKKGEAQAQKVTEGWFFYHVSQFMDALREEQSVVNQRKSSFSSSCRLVSRSVGDVEKKNIIDSSIRLT